MTRDAVISFRRGAALWARIERPERGNACGPEVIDGLLDWLDRGADDDDVRVLVLTGSGSAFCAGADMRAGAELLAADRAAVSARDAGAAASAGDAAPSSLLAYLDRGGALVEAVARAAKPVVAAVNGAAFAGGFELLLAADLAIAARSARLGDAHARHGIVPGWGSSARLPRLIGARAAAELLLSGGAISAEEACRLGIVNAVADDDALDAAVDALVARLSVPDAATSGRILALTRAARDGDGALAAGLARERATLAEHVAAPQFAATVARFLG
ncbi:enoyl-CoA hydratase/isomerase family protein [Conexibacter sp. JD483]|uniref:enoyl-CoA hydratase/isomerase family protein n=1 Tax=unclassified Conexibacter TaxID=2627773 RepID=UPI0027283A9C|nr:MULTISPECIES: enoyl-CoA hydratase/isomerase family protein [unclassified Conexibacter]MDO8187703.1 enoyl-CoA hydratase/isomerase family protein [Conexibacter sp. CPCC 205706]MDO8199888.1 enoyl-CoA hydratase/isomerase family protein [Conexibacter sp. CPCC 205762]MDR9372247.1 enoyl-CoA hydratase/isomerase family protein [Conexibacter sp. JD483]